MRELVAAETSKQSPRVLAFPMFYDDDQGRAAFNQYWARVQERKAEPLILDLLYRYGAAQRQLEAAMDSFKKSARAAFDRLGELKVLLLVANGDNDMVIPTSQSWELIINSRDGHEFIWQ
ncbi:uncharacterized protein Z519_08074 [Cladophialophora bantiana CBS 173.52]|uniref:AB hydrolase-1 domain-containing protein n=1 Tax=Cladophialophora bantiana (strain ATCC 10958 / CBS 173.52 / CDC B-1940 / NIH 8579) TaxID=1442370 RepID=A0A0D2I2Q2_CLAB1|nr:uncharacterized protein Z519_08074 [Cladophialophora bantiana CBS 173.52]KIW91179.1 hypothetical protein Z519_08074 [Cladophialophora bantiana CBS 173.52]